MSKASLLDMLARAAFEALRDGVERSQVNKLLEIYASTKDLNKVLLYLARQYNRGAWSRRRGRSAQILYDALKQCGSDIELRDSLGMFKWLYESGEGKFGNISRTLESQGDVGFFSKYVEACLK